MLKACIKKPYTCPKSNVVPLKISKLIERMLKYEEVERIDWEELCKHFEIVYPQELN
jgi:hypothetical protein